MKQLLCVLIILCVMLAPCVASDLIDTRDLERETPENAKIVIENMDISGDSLDKGIGNLLKTAGRLFPKAFGEGLRQGLILLLIAAFCGIVSTVAEGEAERYVTIGGVLAVAAVAITGLNGMMDLGRDAIGELDRYSKTLLPTLAAAVGMSGAPAGGIMRQAVTAFAGDLLITLYDRVLFPLVYIYATLLTLNAALPRDILKRLAALIKWLCGGVLTLGLIAFTLYLTISGSITGHADAAAIKSAKVALSGSLPVVGSIIADASETLLVGAGAIKSAIGVFGLIVVLGTVLSPLITLAVRYLVFKLTAALTGTVGSDALGDFVNNLAGLYAMIFGMTAASAFILLISIVSFIQAGVSL